jgi:hypothetical protein
VAQLALGNVLNGGKLVYGVSTLPSVGNCLIPCLVMPGIGAIANGSESVRSSHKEYRNLLTRGELTAYILDCPTLPDKLDIDGREVHFLTQLLTRHSAI